MTLSPQQADTSGGPGGFAGGGREVIQANSAVLTDLSKLGKPGQRFSHDFFLPGADVIGALERLAASHGATVIVATHDADLAGRAPRRLAMRDGAVADAALSVVS